MLHYERSVGRLLPFPWLEKRGACLDRSGRRVRQRRLGNRINLTIDALESRTLLAVAPFVGPVAEPPVAPALATETLNVQLQPGVAGLSAQLIPLITAAGASVQRTTVPGLYVLQGPTASIGQLAETLISNPAVKYAAPSKTVSDQALPNDPNFINAGQWYLNGAWGINAPQAWSVTVGSNKVVVADTDTGISYNDPDLYNNVWVNQAEIPSSVLPNLTDVNSDGVITFTDLNAVVNGVKVNQGPGKIQDTNGDGLITATDLLASTSAGGWASGSTQDGATADPDDLIGWNYVNNNNNPNDQNGHGTFTAGEIGAVTNNGVGVAGTVWNAQVMAVQFLDSTGNGTDTAAAQAIDYAVDHGARIINASWGGSGADPTIAAAIQYANQHNVIIVAAAGNNGTNDDTSFFSPASYSSQYPNLIAVAAIGKDGTVPSWSDYGPGTVQLAAPGLNLLGVGLNGAYVGDSGTSMAAPLVAGTLALVETAHPSWSMSQVIDAVIDHTTPDLALQGKVATGGVLNAGAAVANTSGPYVVAGSPDGSVNNSTGLSSVQLTFNEEVNPATLTPSQITLAGPGGPVSGLSVTAVAGSNNHKFVVSFPAQTVAGTYTLSISTGVQDWYGNALNQNRNAVNGEASDIFIETIRQTAPGGADLLSVTGIPTGGTAGTSKTFTVTALGPNGGTDTSYTGTIQLTSTDPQVVLPNYTFTPSNAGTHTFTVTFKTAGVQLLTATDTVNANIVGTEENIVVQPAAASVLKMSGFTSPDTAGTVQAVTVTAYDSYGNIATDYGGTVRFTSSDSQAALPANYTFPPELQGTSTFSITLKTAGTQSITVTDTTTSSATSTESGIVVQNAGLSALSVTGFPSTVAAGTTASFTVSAVDAYGNVIPGYLGTVQFSSSDPHAVLPSSYTFLPGDNSKHTFSATLISGGGRLLKATDTSSNLTGSELVVVQAGPTAQMRVNGFPGNDTAGVAGTVTVLMMDTYGNVTAGYTGKVTLTSSDPQAVLPPSYTFTTGDAGKHTFSVTLESAGTQSITGTDTSNITASESGITVKAAAASVLKVTGFPLSDTAGSAGSVTVTATDAYGNPVTTYTSTVTLSSSDPQAALPAAYTFVAADAGKHTFSVTLKTAGTQSIAATDKLNFTGIESSIVVQASSMQSFRATGFPTSDTAGAPGSITVTAYDAYGNVATSFTGAVSLSSSDPQAVLAPAYTYEAGDGGTHSFAAMLETVGTQSITASTKSLSASETNIVVTAAAAQSITSTGFPTSDTAGSTGSFTVTAYDAYGNVATGYRGTVTLTSSDAHAVLPAAYTFTAGDAGKHNFSVALDTAGTQSLTAADAANLTGSEPNILVKAAAVSTLTVTGFPTSDTAGAAGAAIVTAYDPYGNLATGYTGSVTFSSSDPNALLPSPYKFVAGDSGKHTFSVTLQTAGTQSITATDSSSLTGTESNISVQANAQSITVAGFPSTTTAGVSHSVTVTIYDSHGNVATGYTGTVRLTSTDPNATMPAAYAFNFSDVGTHTFSVALVTVGNWTLTATDTTTSSLSGFESNIAVNAGGASSFVVSAFPSPDTAGVAHNLTISAYDAFGNLATGYAGTVQFSSSDPQATLPTAMTFTPANHGTIQVAATLKTAGAQSITAADNGNSSIKGTESNIVVQPAAVSSITLSGFPVTATAGVSSSFTVTARDVYGNVATGYAGTINFTSTDPKATLPQNYTFNGGDAGNHTFAATLFTAGTRNLKATDTVNPGLVSTESSIKVVAAGAGSLIVAGMPSPDVAGAGHILTITAFDIYGNVATGYTGTIQLSTSDPQITWPTPYTFTAANAGAFSIFVGLKTAGMQSITATDNSNSSLTGTESNITVQPGANAGFQLTGFPSAVTAGMSSSFMLTAIDAYGNLTSGYRGTINFTSTDPNALLPAAYTFIAADAGTHTFSATLTTAGTRNLKATDSVNAGLSGTESNIKVVAAAAQSLAVSGMPSPDTAGVGHILTITAHDGFGNVATGYTGTIGLSTSDPQATWPTTYTFTTANAGVLNVFVWLKTAGVQWIKATDATNSSLTATESNITVQPGAAASLQLTGFPSTVTAGMSSSFTLTAIDAYGNLASGYRGTINFTSTDPNALLPAAYTFIAADAGTHTFSATLTTAGTRNLKATDSVNAGLSGTESNIKVVAAAAQSLAVSGMPSPDTAGIAHAFTITAHDVFGNVATGYLGTVSFSSSDSAAGLPPTYTFVASDSGSHGFVITLNTKGTQSVTQTDSANKLSGSETGIVVQ